MSHISRRVVNRYRKIMGCISVIIAIMFIINTSVVVFAHSGRTDSSGGHRDNKNKSGLGYYHYHCGGNPAHLHSKEGCPYLNGYNHTNDSYNNFNSSQEGNTPKQTGDNWKSENNMKYWYNYDMGYYYTGFHFIENEWYFFGKHRNEGMQTGWVKINDKNYYFNTQGVMVTGKIIIKDKEYVFSKKGELKSKPNFKIHNIQYTETKPEFPPALKSNQNWLFYGDIFKKGESIIEYIPTRSFNEDDFIYVRGTVIGKENQNDITLVIENENPNGDIDIEEIYYVNNGNSCETMFLPSTFFSDSSSGIITISILETNEILVSYNYNVN